MMMIVLTFMLVVTLIAFCVIASIIINDFNIRRRMTNDFNVAMLVILVTTKMDIDRALSIKK